MEKKYLLELIGITYNQIESGVYALILQQKGTNRRIPIIIGFPEAQAIECKLQDIKTPRPLTHDIMLSALKSFDIYIKEIMIKRLPNGVFAADIYLTDGSREIVIDARSSDAIALAIRNNAPIFTTEDVLLEAGFDPDEVKRDNNLKSGILKKPGSNPKVPDYNSMTSEQLSEAINKAAESENYEEAARLKAILDSRDQEKSNEGQQNI